MASAGGQEWTFLPEANCGVIFELPAQPNILYWHTYSVCVLYSVVLATVYVIVLSSACGSSSISCCGSASLLNLYSVVHGVYTFVYSCLLLMSFDITDLVLYFEFLTSLKLSFCQG